MSRGFFHLLLQLLLDQRALGLCCIQKHKESNNIDPTNGEKTTKSTENEIISKETEILKAKSA